MNWESKRILFRVDSSPRIGLGHLMRCLTLATAWRAAGADCHFAMYPHAGHGGDLVTRAGHMLWLLDTPASKGSEAPLNNRDSGIYADWLGLPMDSDADAICSILSRLGEVQYVVLDHYGIDHHWESAVRAAGPRLLVIDDLANRRHDCDFLLDQNFGRSPGDYDGLVGNACKVLAGLEFSLLRPQFLHSRKLVSRRRNKFSLNRLLINLGGADVDNVTSAVLAELATIPELAAVDITVVLGSASIWQNEVKALASSLPLKVQVQVDVADMASLMCESDAAIGAAGSSSWERCCLGLPTLMIVLAENQRQVAMALDQAGIAYLVGDGEVLGIAFGRFIHDCLHSPEKLQDMSARASGLVDGLGCSRVLEALTSV